uniref:Uncharacterized protein n=1 Tax=viral metagenome TaxID=1070528 RepID=A0A6C0JSN7_9ZZZZ
MPYYEKLKISLKIDKNASRMKEDLLRSNKDDRIKEELLRAWKRYFAIMLLRLRKDESIPAFQRIEYIRTTWESFTLEQRLQYK